MALCITISLFFVICAAVSIIQRSDESNKEFYSRILSKNYYETADEFDVRVQCLKILLPDLPIWDHDNYLQFVTVQKDVKNLSPHKSKYLNDINKGWLESYNTYYTRIFEKHSDETLDEYIERIGVIRTTLPYLACWTNNTYLNYVRPHIEAYKLEVLKYHSTSSSTISFKKDDGYGEKKDFSNEQKKSSGELNADDTEEEFIEVKIEGSEEDKTTASIDTTKQYQDQGVQGADPDKVSEPLTRGDIENDKFIIYKKDGETDEQYYRRILVRNYYEDLVKHEVRVECLKVMLPNLPIWRNDKYLSYVTVDNEYYNRPTYVSDRLDDITQHWDETEDGYYRRIFKKYDDERLDQYIERVGIMKTMFHNLRVWVNNNYINYMKPYLEPYKREAERVNSLQLTGSSTSTPDALPIDHFHFSIGSSISAGSDTSPNTNGDDTRNEEDEEGDDKDAEEDDEEDDEEEGKGKKKKNKGKDAKKKENEDYHRRTRESDEDYCKRILGDKKNNKKKGGKNKNMKKLKKSMSKTEFKKLKELCKKNKKE